MSEYPIIQVPADAREQLETLGTKAKFWFRAADGTRTLFKEGFPGSGEHWAEKVASEVARGLGLPHARYHLAVWDGRPGVVSPIFVPEDVDLVHGNELLAKVHKEYDQTRRFRSSQHTVGRVVAVLHSPAVLAPTGWHCPVEVGNAAGVFAGYLMLDALIANQDRHHENWGLIRWGSALHLAPTFDHASSLGRNETDESRIQRLSTRDRGRSVAAYVRRARSGLYKSQSSTKPLSPLEAFIEIRTMTHTASDYWLRQLRHLDEAALESILAAVPATMISEPARRFALAVMRENRNCLLALPPSPR